MAEPKETDAPTTASVSRDALLYLPGRAIPAVVQILTVTVLTWFFAAEDIGRFELAMRFTLFLATLSSMWLNMGVLRLYPAHAMKQQSQVFTRVVRRLRWATVAIGAVLGLAAYQLGPDALFGSYRSLLIPSVITFACYTLFEMGLAFLRAQHKPGVYSIATTVNSVVRLPLAVILFTVFGLGVEGMLWAIAALNVAAYLLVIRPRLEQSEDTPDAEPPREVAREMLLYGIPIMGTQLLNFFMTNLDRYLLKLWQGDEAVGFYAVASNLIEQPMVLVFQTFALAVIPSVAMSWESQGRQATEELVTGVTRMFFLLCIPLLTLLAVLAPTVFAVLARGETSAASVAAPWLATAALIYGFSYFANLGLHLAKRTAIMLVITAMAVAANITANYFLIPEYGFVGAGMARVLSNTVLVALFLIAASASMRFVLPWLSLARITLSAAAMGAILWFAQSLLPAGLLTREFTVADLSQALSAARNRLR